MAEIIKSFSYYGQRIMTVLTQDELELPVVFSIKDKPAQGSKAAGFTRTAQTD